jgi:hypothetical protein
LSSLGNSTTTSFFYKRRMPDDRHHHQPYVFLGPNLADEPYMFRRGKNGIPSQKKIQSSTSSIDHATLPSISAHCTKAWAYMILPCPKTNFARSRRCTGSRIPAC